MKKVDTCIRHSCQVLILILYETACAQISSTHRSSIINETTSIIHGEEDQPLHLQCPFSVTNTVLKRNGRIVKESRLGTLVYSLILRKEDHNSTFTCETYTSAGRKRTKNTATLDIRYKPFLSMNYTSNSVYEGQSVTLCCSSYSRPLTTEMWWDMESRILSSDDDTNVLCHKIINISREDSGSYKCSAENEIGIVNDEVIITVLYPPNIPDQHIHFTDTDVLRTLQCLANGVPAKYSYGRWQHLSRFGEHIRYLNSSPDGKVTLPPIANKMERYQDNGIYLCTASNTVADSFGNSFQTGKTFVMSNVRISSYSRPLTTEMWWDMESRILSSDDDTNVLCHKIINISREDSGSYKCSAENEIGVVNDEVIITVLYPPNIPDQHIHFTDTDVLRTLQCLANGVPAKYSYGRWQHLSRFGEHIRYLNSSPDGKVTLPPIANKMERYQDNGIYLCTASNTVADSFGNSFQTGKTFVMSNGPPVFVKKIEHKQYGQIGKIFNMKFIVYSTSEIECYNIKSENKEIRVSSEMTHVNSSMVFHGTELSVETIEVVLSFNISNKSSRQDYTVTLCNGYGNSSFVVDLKSVQVYVGRRTKNDDPMVAIITFTTFVVMCVPILGAAVFLRRKRNRRTSEDVSESESVDGQPVPGENIVYQNATHSVAFRPTPIQTSVEVIEYNRGSYTQEQNTAPLIGQLNYADVIFQPSTTQDVVQIIGIENRTIYADVNVSAGATSSVDTRSVNE
ncbi:HMCN [Mytilus coruscus]|uniref:HMCN n=1 Tax=Mytilus coruscus TaxID=42192 RepID=A0A6J8B357_MYTCO|nr:HMCN [Mytilus coruscus]